MLLCFFLFLRKIRIPTNIFYTLGLKINNKGMVQKLIYIPLLVLLPFKSALKEKITARLDPTYLIFTF